MSRNNFNKLSKNMKRLSKIVEKNAETEVDKLVIAALTNIIISTPVDTGAARANWLVSASSTPKREANLSKTDPNGASTILAGHATVLSNKSNIYIVSNNLPYIDQLNKGYSPQAPAGFVETSVDKAVASTIKRARFTK